MMNAWQKQRIREMRAKGTGFKKIGDEIGATTDAVKGYCRRNGMSGFGWAARIDVNAQEERVRCRCCGKLLKRNELGRKRMYCSDACKQRYYRKGGGD